MEEEKESRNSLCDMEKLASQQLKSEIKQFQFNSLSQQSAGLKRSITTAALLSFVLPVLISLLLAFFPYIKHGVEVDIQRGPDKKFSDLIIKNKSASTINSMVLNFIYNRSSLINYNVNIPDNIYANVSLIGKKFIMENGEGDNKDSPFRGSFKVDNLKGESSIKIHLEFYESSEDFNIDEILGDRIKLIKGQIGVFTINWVYYGCIFFVFIVIMLQASKYKKTLSGAKNLENCLKFIFYNFNVDSNKKALKGQPLSKLSEHWKILRCKDIKNTPKELDFFFEFVTQNNMIMHGKNVIWFAPFDLLGSPTFTKLFARNKSAMIIQLDKASNIVNLMAYNIMATLFNEPPAISEEHLTK